MGTLAGALGVRQIPSEPKKVEALVEGDIEAVESVLRITRIRVQYRLRVPQGKREAAQRAVDTHPEKCPAYNSIRGCIPVEITAEIVEESPDSSTT